MAEHHQRALNIRPVTFGTGQPMLGKPSMQHRNKKATIELGMKVSVRRSSRSHIGVVTRIEGDYVFVRWTNSDFAETAEYQAHLDDVTPLAGWF